MGHAIEKHGVEGKEKGEGQREYEADCISIMLQDYLGIEITDARRRHFKNFGRKFSVTCLRDESPFSLSNL